MQMVFHVVIMMQNLNIVEVILQQKSSMQDDNSNDSFFFFGQLYSAAFKKTILEHSPVLFPVTGIPNTNFKFSNLTVWNCFINILMKTLL